MDLKLLTQQVEELSRDVAAFILAEAKDFSSDKVESKSFNNLVSYVDKTAEERFVKGLSTILPEAGFIAEEGSGQPKEGLNWIIDPLDGTTNFIHGIPCYCTSVALIDDTELLCGVVHEVNQAESFSAFKNGGAFLNGKPIQVSEKSTLSESLLATGFPYDDFEREKEYMQLLNDLMHASRGLRRLGSAAADLAYVACGRFEAFYEYGLNPWDVAAGILIVQEAGGSVSDFSGGNNHIFGEEIIASNGKVHADILSRIEACFI